jgi:hypothetical protein
MMVRSSGAAVVLALLLAASTQQADAQFTCTDTSAAGTVTCAALGDLYAATNGARWATQTGWLAAAAGTATDFCTFFGVTCTSGAVTSLCALTPAA